MTDDLPFDYRVPGRTSFYYAVVDPTETRMNQVKFPAVVQLCRIESVWVGRRPYCTEKPAEPDEFLLSVRLWTARQLQSENLPFRDLGSPSTSTSTFGASHSMCNLCLPPSVITISLAGLGSHDTVSRDYLILHRGGETLNASQVSTP